MPCFVGERAHGLRVVFLELGGHLRNRKRDRHHHAIRGGHDDRRDIERVKHMGLPGEQVRELLRGGQDAIVQRRRFVARMERIHGRDDDRNVSDRSRLHEQQLRRALPNEVPVRVGEYRASQHGVVMGVFDDEIRAPFDCFPDDGFVQRVVPACIGVHVEALRDQRRGERLQSFPMACQQRCASGRDGLGSESAYPTPRFGS